VYYQCEKGDGNPFVIPPESPFFSPGSKKGGMIYRCQNWVGKQFVPLFSSLLPLNQKGGAQPVCLVFLILMWPRISLEHKILFWCWVGGHGTLPAHGGLPSSPILMERRVIMSLFGLGDLSNSTPQSHHYGSHYYNEIPTCI
jgi:hypothetical protein